MKSIFKKGAGEVCSVYKCKKTVLKKTNTTFLPEKNEINLKTNKKKDFKGCHLLSCPLLSPQGPPQQPTPHLSFIVDKTKPRECWAVSGPSGRGLCEGAVHPDASEARDGT